MTQSAPRTQSNRRRELVQDDLARVAINLFVERGYDHVVVDDIAEAAGISQRTFFRYFDSKESIVLRYERHLGQRLIEALRTQPAQLGPVSALRSAFITTASVPAKHRAEVRRLGRMLSDSSSLHTRAHGERGMQFDDIAAILSSRMGVDAETDPRPILIAASVTSTAMAAWDRWVGSTSRRNPADEISEAIAFISQIDDFDAMHG
jgi:AcrR family transcriptional regulator